MTMRTLEAHVRGLGRKALVPYLTVGYPDPDTFLEVCATLAGSGADVLELGLPYSDPLADGPTIQASSNRAIEHGVVGEVVYDLIAEARRRIDIPIVLMSYINPLLPLGWDGLAERLGAVGVSGLIVPDLPIEEARPLQEALQERDLGLTYLVAPTTRQSRLQEIAKATTGYLYLVSVTGTTGARTDLAMDLEPIIASIRDVADVPVFIGFGISTPEQAAKAATISDGVIVGSALIQTIATNSKDPMNAVKAFIRSLREGIDRG